MTTGHAILINLHYLNNAPVNVTPPPPPPPPPNRGGAGDLVGKMVSFDCEYVPDDGGLGRYSLLR
jgi:hypothetical protein